jgi:hypothetical protein
MRLTSENLASQMERKDAWKREAEAAVEVRLEQVKDGKAQVVSDAHEVIGDITREFKVQQNEYRRRIEALQAYVAELEKKLSDTQTKIRKTRD